MISADTMRSLPDHFADIDAIAIDGKTMRNAIYTDARAPAAEARAANGDAKPATGKIGENQCQVHILGAVGQRDGVTLTQKKSTASRSAPDDETKRTNEIGTVVPMLEGLELDFAGKTFTADALLTQRKLADFLHDRGATSYSPPRATSRPCSTTSGCSSHGAASPTSASPSPLSTGALKARAIWTTARLNWPPDLPPRRTGLPRRAHRRRQEVPQALGRIRPRHHQPRPRHRRRPAPAPTQPRHWKVESVHNILDGGRVTVGVDVP